MNALDRLHKRSIRVTDFASQYWCERQMELRYLYGEKVSAEVKKGAQIHEILENEVNVPILLEPKSYSDYVYKILYTNHVALEELVKNRRTRELQIFGFMEGFNVVGKIDELEVKEDGVAIVEDKTRAKDNLPNEAQLLPNRIQVMFYKSVLEQMRSGSYTAEMFRKAFSTDRLVISSEFERQLTALGIEKDMHTLNSIVVKSFASMRRLGSVSDTLYIRYRNQFTGKTIKLYKFYYDNTDLENAKRYLFDYWKGLRGSKPVPVEEKWKCNYCVFFGNHCKVWWPQKRLEQ